MRMAPDRFSCGWLLMAPGDARPLLSQLRSARPTSEVSGGPGRRHRKPPPTLLLGQASRRSTWGTPGLGTPGLGSLRRGSRAARTWLAAAAETRLTHAPGQGGDVQQGVGPIRHAALCGTRELHAAWPWCARRAARAGAAHGAVCCDRASTIDACSAQRVLSVLSRMVIV